MTSFAKRLFIASAFMAAVFPALASAQYVIPLERVNINPGPGSPGYPALPVYKLGIWVGIGGGPQKLYEFDTGGKGFWASYTAAPDSGVSQWWGSFTPNGGTLSNTYSSGYSYVADSVKTSVQIYASGTASTPILSTLPNIDIAQVTGADVPDQPSSYYATQVNAGQPYLYSDFYGDFGAALLPKSQSGYSVYSVLPQIDAGTDYNGFIIRNGATNPTLQVGISAADNASFTTQVAMTLDGGTFPHTGVPTFAEQLFNAKVELGSGVGKQSFTGIPIVIDTGAPVASVRQDSGLMVDNQYVSDLSYSDQGRDKTISIFTDGTPFDVKAAGAAGYSPLDAGLITGSTIGSDLFSIDAPSTGYVNLGMNTFTNYDVMFNLTSGVNAGNIGFSAVPEPASISLLAVAGSALALRFRKKRA